MTQGNHREDNAWKRLLPMAVRDTRVMDGHPDAPPCSAFVAREQERFADLTLPTDGLVVVLEGRKDVRVGIHEYAYHAGDAFVANAGVPIDVTNVPDSRSGFYRALFVQLPRPILIEAARRWPQFVGSTAPASRRLVVDVDLTEALIHAFGRDEAVGTPQSSTLRQHRVLEVVLVLAERGVIALTPKYADRPLGDTLRGLLAHRLHHPWTAAEAASLLGCSEATLRRKLRREGLSFAKLVSAERMAAAHVLLTERGANVADTLAATGMTSRSHFATRYRRLFGERPSEARAKRTVAAT
ncbi:AraC family transcriptional regulator [Caulobacter sp. BP25]|uniref:helix-turn-helix transcriptional regulator n=1 Tax=Caulobacter sp. BP25 TaxID=2048900 RepID=UPI00137480F6|nr:helix-turn-helix domain-containing protein [Caulobacter sp. BP25]